MLKISQQKLKLEQDMTAADSGESPAHRCVNQGCCSVLLCKHPGGWMQITLSFLCWDSPFRFVSYFGFAWNNKLERSFGADGRLVCALQAWPTNQGQTRARRGFGTVLGTWILSVPMECCFYSPGEEGTIPADIATLLKASLGL